MDNQYIYNNPQYQGMSIDSNNQGYQNMPLNNDMTNQPYVDISNDINNNKQVSTSIFNHYGVIDRGVVPTLNEDNMDGFLLLNDSVLCLCVADGLGSVHGGHISSVIAIKELQRYLQDFLISDEPENMKYVLYNGLYMINRIMHNFQRINPQLYGSFTSTITVVLINQNKTMVVGHIGNSRLYLLRDGNIYQLTDDDTIPYPLLKENKMTLEEYRVHPDRNKLTRFLGDIDFKAYVEIGNVSKNDLLLLCTNGIYEMLTDEQIKEIVYETGNSKDACESLIMNANNMGGIDNMGVIMTFIDF